jgi:HEXXH motif-containing protein
LAAAAVSPWVFCLYSQLVAELSRHNAEQAARIITELGVAAAKSAEPGLTALRDPETPDAWWDHFQVLLDTDPRRSFRPQAPTSANFASCGGNVAAGLSLLAETDPKFHQEVRALARMLVLADPASADPADGFNGASSFFLWGAVLLNSAVRRSRVAVVDLIVHESSHLLLFGIAGEGPLTSNSGTDRFKSPVRSDERPIDGIFHACFVTTRVHLAMSRMLAATGLCPSDRDDLVEHKERNGKAALGSLATLAEHALPTELGEKVLGELRQYWASHLP